MLLRLCSLLVICTSAFSQRSASDFEAFAAGVFTQVAADGLELRAAAGHAEIHAEHQRSGKHSLRILGGEVRSVTIEFSGGVEAAHELSFWAERWTARDPFEWRFEVQSGRRAWRGVGVEDEIKVGGFKTHVRVPLAGKALDRVRITCTSPPNSGLLIDDLLVTVPAPKRVVELACEQVHRPLLIGKPRMPLLRIRVLVEGNLGALPLERVVFGVLGNQPLDYAELFHTRVNTFDPNAEPGTESTLLGSADSPSGLAKFQMRHELEEGENFLWLTARAGADADLTRRVDAGLAEIVVAGNKLAIPEKHPVGSSRIGVAVRDAGWDDVHTYRIPGLATTNAGTLIAVYDLRHRAGRDLPGDVDVGMSRSTDRGRTWEPMRTIMDMGAPHDTNGIGDPAVLVDRATGTIWVAATWSFGNRAWNGSGPGLEPAETGQLMLARSDDDGKSWSKPINITRQVKDPKWNYLLQGPGKGITLADGTLVFAAQYKDENALPFSTLIHSKDHGETWSIGTGARPNTTEAQVVQLSDGSLMLNMRDNRGGSRAVMTTADLGQTWTEHPSSRSLLPEPVCMASLIRFPRAGGHLLLFSNPSVSQAPRRDITIQVSHDEGRSWKERLLLHAPTCAGYSCMTVVDDEHVGILYEGGSSAHLVFELVPIAELLE